MTAGKALMLMAVFAVAVVCEARECVYDDRGLCMHECPKGTVSYVSPCGTGMTMTQRTCRQPVAKSMGMICDLSRCDCVEPKLWDEEIKKCVLPEDCSKINSVPPL